jgi:DNA modification methylase
VIDAERIKNPAKLGFVKHEAERDPIEFIQIIKAYSKAGDVVGDFFSGVAKWVKQALRLGRHMIVSDVNRKWVEAIAADLESAGEQSGLLG